MLLHESILDQADDLRNKAHSILESVSELVELAKLCEGMAPIAQIFTTDEPEWMTIARAEIGVREISGPKHSPRVLEYHSITGLGASDDETPWCASFVCWCLEQAGIWSPKSAASAAFRTWGVQVQDPQHGDLVVFDHGGGRGHVGFFTSREGSTVSVLGGNQSNAVGVAQFGLGKLHSYRRPEVGTR